ncbi:uncharacterized protein IUM83_12855 [Phytophthora cinnamomi]|uniref:uncharacterized protein n=1 Tax=Phytophthora cinnamomi TaxID=4785 RepID=UPI00355AA3E7|nr:hypothetical protein IUM83_12855 [Phytophthora cinnamomi]
MRFKGMALLGKVFVGGKVQPSEGSIDPSQLCLATAAQASPLLVNNNPSRDEKYSSHRRSRPSSSSISSAFQHLTIAPNYTVNWVMKTQSFDGGSFWLLVDPSPTVLALGILGLWTVGIGYLSLLMRIVKLGKPIQAKESEEDNLLQPKLMIFRRSLAHDESIWHQRAASTIQLVKEIADGGSPLGYAAKVAIKFGDFLTDFVLLYLNLEAGSPLPLTIVFTTITVSSVLSSAVLVSLPSARTSLLLETLLDTLFDFLVAIAYPCLALIYCFSTFSFDYKVLDINLDIYPSGWFETFAGVIADPVQTAIIHRILKSLRIVSVLDFFVRVGVNLFLCEGVRSSSTYH